MNWRKFLRQNYLLARCLALAPFVPGLKPFSTEQINSCRHIAVLTQDRLGDLVCSLPTFHALRERFPQAQITACAPAYVHPLLKQHRDINNVMALNELLNSAVKFDLAIDLSTDYPLEKARLSKKAGIPLRIGYNVHGRGVCYTHPLPFPKEKIHVTDLLLGLLSPLGISNANRIPHLDVLPEWEKEYRDISRKECPGKSPVVAFHAGGTYWTQRWPEENFAALGDRLAELTGAPILLVGAASESAINQKIADAMKTQPINLCGKIGMGALAAALFSVKLAVCNNSGPLHLAAALGTSTVSTMGPTAPEYWWPLGERQVVIQKKIPCISCNEGVCRLGTHECLRSITVEEMLNESIKQLKETGDLP